MLQTIVQVYLLKKKISKNSLCSKREQFPAPTVQILQTDIGRNSIETGFSKARL